VALHPLLLPGRNHATSTGCCSSGDRIRRGWQDNEPEDGDHEMTKDRTGAGAWLMVMIGWGAVLPGAAQDVILGRPTDRSVTANLLSHRNLETFVEYGTRSGAYNLKTAVFKVEAGEPLEIKLEGLQPDTRYYYRLRSPDAGAEATFHTQRPAGATFIFAVEADPHTTNDSAPEVFRRSLRHQLASSADFLIDLGDTFMSDKLESPTWDSVVSCHLQARSYFALVGHSLPLFLALGNHEGERGRLLDGSANNLAVRATNARKLYYPNPEPGPFYSGSARSEPFVGRRQNYYAWTWADALFVVLDPYWYTTARPGQGGDNWYLTLGREQYDWLKDSLERSSAKFKFVFAHNLVGGLNLDGRARAGIEGAAYFEWGGHNQDGSWGFSGKRPGWDMPIHHLLVKYNVRAFFHGHDHLYAKQDLDGVVYQEVPQPSRSRERSPAERGYTRGDILPGSGYLRVRVSPDGVKVEFIRTDEGAGEVAHAYSILPRLKNTSESLTTMAGSKVTPAPSEQDPVPAQPGGRNGKGRRPPPDRKK
jgi:hypothetical protein